MTNVSPMVAQWGPKRLVPGGGTPADTRSTERAGPPYARFIIIVLGTRGLYRIAFNVGGQVEDSTRLEAKGLGG